MAFRGVAEYSLQRFVFRVSKGRKGLAFRQSSQRSQTWLEQYVLGGAACVSSVCLCLLRVVDLTLKCQLEIIMMVAMTAMLVSVAELSNIFSVLVVLICFCAMVLFIMR